jgi:hypothetical protein
MQPPPAAAAPPCRSGLRRIVRAQGVLLGGYLFLAYLAVPLAWRLHYHRRPTLDDAPRVTRTGNGIPGDPLNLALVGREADIASAFVAAGWYPADPVTLRSSLRIVGDSVLGRPYDDAPVSSLYLDGRKQDLAFEQPVGDSPRKRHHVRFWKLTVTDADGRPLWLGAATYDTRVGLSHRTGQVTHHIGPDVDADRDKVIGDLEKAKRLSRVRYIDGFQRQRAGRNGSGDPWHTDGRLAVGWVVPAPAPPRP